MTKKRGNKSMLISTLIMCVIAIILFLAAYFKGDGGHLIGLKLALDMVVQILPLLFCAFVVAGMVQILIPPEVISK